MSRRCAKEQTRLIVVPQYGANTTSGAAADLLVRSHGFAKVSQQVVRVAQVAVGPTLSGAIAELLHDGQVRPGDYSQYLVTGPLKTKQHINSKDLFMTFP